MLPHSDKIPTICAGHVPKLPKMSLFEPREKSQKRMATSKFCPPVGQIDHKNVKNMDKSLSNVQRLPKISLFEPKKKSTKRIAM